jgi:hypothetical protein
MKNIIFVAGLCLTLAQPVLAQEAKPKPKPAVATPAVTKADAGKPVAPKKEVKKPTRDPVAEKKKKDAEKAAAKKAGK